MKQGVAVGGGKSSVAQFALSNRPFRQAGASSPNTGADPLPVFFLKSLLAKNLGRGGGGRRDVTSLLIRGYDYF